MFRMIADILKKTQNLGSTSGLPFFNHFATDRVFSSLSASGCGRGGPANSLVGQCEATICLSDGSSGTLLQYMPQ